MYAEQCRELLPAAEEPLVSVHLDRDDQVDENATWRIGMPVAGGVGPSGHQVPGEGGVAGRTDILLPVDDGGNGGLADMCGERYCRSFVGEAPRDQDGGGDVVETAANIPDIVFARRIQSAVEISAPEV